MSDWAQKYFEKAMKAAEAGEWDTAIHYAKLTPPSWDPWQQFPSIAANNGSGMPNEAVHKVLDVFAKHPKHKESSEASFLFEYASNIPEHADAKLLDRVAMLGLDDHYVSEKVTTHANYKPDLKTEGIQGVAKFWYEYERKVQPHHFATVKSLYTKKPEELVDHRGNAGHSIGHSHLLEHFEPYAKLAQAAVLKDAQEYPYEEKPKKYPKQGVDYKPEYISEQEELDRKYSRIPLRNFKGRPHVRVFRGITGEYADKLLQLSEFDLDTRSVAKKLVNMPVSHLTSWSTDPRVAARFAADRDISGQKRTPIVISKWMPLDDLLHSGWHKVIPTQEHAHEQEREFVFGSKNGRVKIPTENIHVVDENDYNIEPLHVRPVTPKPPKAAKAPQPTPTQPTQEVELPTNKSELWGPQHLKKDEAESTGDNLHGWGIQEHSQIVQDMLGYQPNLHSTFEAARFLASGDHLPLEQVRKALWDADGDFEEAALLAYSIPVNEQNLNAIRAIRKMQSVEKSESIFGPSKKVEPILPESREAAQAIQRAMDEQFVFHIKLDGKHSDGAMLARDQQQGDVWLLKPGSGGQSPALGAREEAASQSERESAFWHVADMLGLGQDIPRTDLVTIDGKQYAAIKLLPWSYKTLDAVRQKDPNKPRELLLKLLRHGVLHKWAVLDMILGNPDRHANNVMVGDQGEVALIDHGSAFASWAFDPGNDRNSFVPYYLRAWAPKKFNILDPVAKLKALPRINEEMEKYLKNWILRIDGAQVANLLQCYHIDPGPTLHRLHELKTKLSTMSADLAVNQMWVD